jgi:hypothetical protein
MRTNIVIDDKSVLPPLVRNNLATSFGFFYRQPIGDSSDRIDAELSSRQKTFAHFDVDEIAKPKYHWRRKSKHEKIRINSEADASCPRAFADNPRQRTPLRTGVAQSESKWIAQISL